MSVGHTKESVIVWDDNGNDLDRFLPSLGAYSPVQTLKRFAKQHCHPTHIYTL